MKYLKDENQVLELGESSTRFGGIKYMSWGNEVHDNIDECIKQMTRVIFEVLKHKISDHD